MFTGSSKPVLSFEADLQRSILEALRTFGLLTADHPRQHWFAQMRTDPAAVARALDKHFTPEFILEQWERSLEEASGTSRVYHRMYGARAILGYAEQSTGGFAPCLQTDLMAALHVLGIITAYSPESDWRTSLTTEPDRIIWLLQVKLNAANLKWAWFAALGEADESSAIYGQVESVYRTVLRARGAVRRHEERIRDWGIRNDEGAWGVP